MLSNISLISAAIEHYANRENPELNSYTLNVLSIGCFFLTICCASVQGFAQVVSCCLSHYNQYVYLAYCIISASCIYYNYIHLHMQFYNHFS